MTANIRGLENAIQNAMATYLQETNELDMRPLVGNFIVIAEAVHPDTGVVMLSTIRSEDLPLWTEYGMLRMRENILEMAQTQAMYYDENHDHNEEN